MTSRGRSADVTTAEVAVTTRVIGHYLRVIAAFISPRFSSFLIVLKYGVIKFNVWFFVLSLSISLIFESRHFFILIALTLFR